uniref:Uncharacterized protein n=1 Tax=Arundo donax TaxID=35708 RepID=A0A0A9G4L9_ARUDO
MAPATAPAVMYNSLLSLKQI